MGEQDCPYIESSGDRMVYSMLPGGGTSKAIEKGYPNGVCVQTDTRADAFLLYKYQASTHGGWNVNEWATLKPQTCAERVTPNGLSSYSIAGKAQPYHAKLWFGNQPPPGLFGVGPDGKFNGQIYW